jgi:hypothetical protein
MRIISGGQTGVDRGALDAALAAGFPIGGYCPAERSAEDGVIPDRYPLTALDRGGPLERTLMNVAESDGTAILYFESPSGGTEKTLQACLFLQRPYLLIDAELCLPEAAAERIRGFCKLHQIEVLILPDRAQTNGMMDSISPMRPLANCSHNCEPYRP